MLNNEKSLRKTSHESKIPVTSSSVNDSETFWWSLSVTSDDSSAADVCCFWFVITMTQSQKSAENDNKSVEHVVFGMTDLSIFPFADRLEEQT